MNELNLQNPYFLRNVIRVDINKYRIKINYKTVIRTYTLLSFNRALDKHQIWQPLGQTKKLISFNDLKILNHE
jgi:hypothetical protein